MKVIGLDIGTTTICAVLVDLHTAHLAEVVTKANATEISTTYKWQRIQNPGKILHICTSILDGMLRRHKDVAAIGISGQMHGIVYVNGGGDMAGPLVTWQDGRGNLDAGQGKSYAALFKEETGTSAASGFGLVTLFYDSLQREVPPEAAGVCTIGDFVAMALCGNRKPRVHASNAASLGGFSVQNNRFADVLPACINPSMLPELVDGEQIIGNYCGVPVCCAIGDNQASAFGSLGCGVNVLINVGTGSQISAVCREPVSYTNGLECRPYVAGSYLSVGAALCGGYAYALLHEFFVQAAGLLGAQVPEDLYARMSQSAASAMQEPERLSVDTHFNGTRLEPQRRGYISRIGSENLTPGQLCLGVLEGICNELKELSKGFVPALQPQGLLAGSGNGVRSNAVFQRIIEQSFCMPLQIPCYKEEAAFGSALLAGVAAGHLTYEQATGFIRYE